MGKYIMALDQGTTSSRTILFDKKGNIVCQANKEFEQIFPKLGLGLVYNVTANSRAMQEEKTKTEAYNTVMPGLGSFDNVSFDSVAADKYIKEQINKNETEKTIKSYNATIDEVIKAKDKSGNDLGYIITVTDNEAYGGSLQMTVGIKDDGTVMGISFLSLSETPGLGMKAKDDDFMSQFSNKKVDFFKYTKSEAKADNEINAISSATITPIST